MHLQMIQKLTPTMKVQRNKTPGSRKDRNDESKCEKRNYICEYHHACGIFLRISGNGIHDYWHHIKYAVIGMFTQAVIALPVGLFVMLLGK